MLKEAFVPLYLLSDILNMHVLVVYIVGLIVVLIIAKVWNNINETFILFALIWFISIPVVIGIAVLILPFLIIDWLISLIKSIST